MALLDGLRELLPEQNTIAILGQEFLNQTEKIFGTHVSINFKIPPLNLATANIFDVKDQGYVFINAIQSENITPQTILSEKPLESSGYRADKTTKQGTRIVLVGMINNEVVNVLGDPVGASLQLANKVYTTPQSQSDAQTTSNFEKSKRIADSLTSTANNLKNLFVGDRTSEMTKKLIKWHEKGYFLNIEGLKVDPTILKGSFSRWIIESLNIGLYNKTRDGLLVTIGLREIFVNSIDFFGEIAKNVGIAKKVLGTLSEATSLGISTAREFTDFNLEINL